MSKYTLELRRLVQTFGREEVKEWFKDYELTDYLTPEEIAIIEKRNTWTKDKLADRIVDHFYMREIGYETPAYFKIRAKVALQEIMEEKLPLIYSVAIEYDPLVNVNYTETFEHTNTGTSTSKSNSNGLAINSDTPMGNIDKAKILSGTYASSTSGSESDITDKSSSMGQENYTKTIKGNSGVSATAQAMVKQYRDNILTINKDIIKELEPLFIGLY